MGLAAIVGLFTGLAAVAFGELIDFVDWFAFDMVAERMRALGPWRVALLPAAGALLAAPIVLRLVRETRGQGVSQVMFAVETSGGRIGPLVAPAKAVATALTIGAGGSAGREGPVTQIGAGIGSTVAQALRLSDDNTRLLVGAGVAGGVATMFNAPIAGVFFALEVVLRNFNTRNFSVVVLAAVVATFVEVALLGDKPAIAIPAYGLESAIELPLYAALGLLSAAAAVLFVRLIYAAEDRFLQLRVPSTLLVPAIGGLIAGLLAVAHIGVLGEGVATMDQVLRGEFNTRTVLLLALLKPLATAATIGAGGSGGVFRPALFIGAMIGISYGSAATAVFPNAVGEPAAYAIVGMAAFFAATSRAPMSAVMMLFEMTRGYELILPLMIAVAVATLAAQVLGRGSVYSIGLERRGVHIDEEQAPLTVMQTLRVSDAMSPIAVTCRVDTPISEVMRELAGDPEAAPLVLDDEDAIVGIISNADLNEAIAGGDHDRPAFEIASRDVRTVFADHTLHDALGIFAFAQSHSLPVVTREDPRRAVGALRRSDITQAYSGAVERRDTATRRNQLRSVTSDDVRYLELRVMPRSALSGRQLSEVQLTEDAVIVAVRHNGATLIPRGHTRIAAGDRVTLIAAAAAVEEVRAIFEGESAG